MSKEKQDKLSQSAIFARSATSDEMLQLLYVSRQMAKEHDLARLLSIITTTARKLLQADRATLFVVDEANNELWSMVTEKLEIREIRVPIVEKSIAGSVAVTGEIVNIKNVYQDSRFDSSWDKKTGYLTKSMLAMPLLNLENSVIGVLQIINKENKASPHFESRDVYLGETLCGQAAIALDNAMLYQEREAFIQSMIDILSATIDARDPITAGHSKRVTELAVKMGKEMGLGREEQRILEIAGGLHDVGKIGIRDDVLFKPGKLDENEYDHIKSHAQLTLDILERIKFSKDLKDVVEIAATHHEKLDGSGYPRGLSEEAIPLGGKILAVADIYDALSAWDRPYKPALPKEKVFSILEEGRGKQLDGRCIDALKKIVG